MPTRPIQPEGDSLANLFDWIRRHLKDNLAVADLAAKARMTRRTFIRRFEEATGVPPGEWVLRERLALARNLLEATRMSVERVATASGFGSTEALRHHFRVRLDTSPVRYRASFRA